MWLQNIKDWTGMALEKMITAARNWEEWKRTVRQLQIANATEMDGFEVIVLTSLTQNQVFPNNFMNANLYANLVCRWFLVKKLHD